MNIGRTSAGTRQRGPSRIRRRGWQAIFVSASLLVAAAGSSQALSSPPGLLEAKSAMARPAADSDGATRFERVIGLDRVAIEALFGAPQQRAEPPPAVVWRYESSDCAVEVYFYLDLTNQVMRALLYEVIGHDLGERRPDQCYDQLFARGQMAGHPA
jgi:hypothetical protein